jgi:endonuclease I
MRMKHSFLAFLLFFCACTLSAQVPLGYYNSAAGLSGTALQQALHYIIDEHNPVTYSAVWYYFQSTDKKDDGTVWDIYSDVPGGTPAYTYQFTTDQCTTGGSTTEGVCYVREHSFPRSWFGGDISPMYTDIFILYPTDACVNGKRSNYPYGAVSNPTTTFTNGSKLGPCATDGYTGTAFEPIDEYKGDLARTYFYMSTRYYNLDSGWPGSPMTDGAQLKKWALIMMLQWASQDTVSQKEINRNNAIYHIQGNRNPFVDHPEYAQAIWGNGTGIDEKSTASLTVYPNPAADNASTLLPQSLNGKTAGIFVSTVTGARVDVPVHFGQNLVTFDVHNLPSGIYFLTMTGDGETIYHGKIVKK